MAWTIKLEDENKNALVELEEAFLSHQLENVEFLASVKLLQYLDPYGDTIFNSLQINDLIGDLILLQKAESNNARIASIIELAKQCKTTTHSYLVFYGD